MRPRAIFTLRESDAYAPGAFREGLRRIGYEPTTQAHVPTEKDILLVWNRRRTDEALIRSCESRGARVVVAENGYLGTDESGGKLFALALGHHSGAGWWPVGDGSRWKRLGIEVKPWRHDGEHVLVFGQRNIGEFGVAAPEGWGEAAFDAVRRLTCRKVKLRPHPGVARTDPYDDLRGAWAAVTWSSGAALKALVAGYPVFHALRDWIGGPAANPWPGDIESPNLPDRLPMLERLAWAQWTRAEIASGEALAWLLS